MLVIHIKKIKVSKYVNKNKNNQVKATQITLDARRIMYREKGVIIFWHDKHICIISNCFLMEIDQITTFYWLNIKIYYIRQVVEAIKNKISIKHTLE